MGLKTAAILLAFWSLGGAPSLCLGDVLGHQCNPQAPCCGDDAAGEEPCGHESDCLGDPCVEARQPDDSPEELLQEAVDLSPLHGGLILEDPERPFSRAMALPPPFPEAVASPFADCNQPLLI